MATGPVLQARDRLNQDQRLLTGVVIRAGVYANGFVPPTPEARAEAAQGVMGIALRPMAHDLTVLERTEAERRALEVSLREAQKMESPGTLAGGVADDFSNVLAAVLGNVAIARHDTDAGHPRRETWL